MHKVPHSSVTYTYSVQGNPNQTGNVVVRLFALGILSEGRVGEKNYYWCLRNYNKLTVVALFIQTGLCFIINIISFSICLHTIGILAYAYRYTCNVARIYAMHLICTLIIYIPSSDLNIYKVYRSITIISTCDVYV